MVKMVSPNPPSPDKNYEFMRRTAIRDILVNTTTTTTAVAATAVTTATTTTTSATTTTNITTTTNTTTSPCVYYCITSLYLCLASFNTQNGGLLCRL
jgi:hypothetical protein